MSAVVVLVLIGAVIWVLWAPAMAWIPGLRSLLDRPVSRAGLVPFIGGLETAGGDYQGRPVLIALHHKRGRHSLGYLVLAMRPRIDRPLGVDAHAHARVLEVRDALEELEGREGLHVACEDGWLKVRWQPGGVGAFPGRFDPSRWRRVLRAMAAIVASLETIRESGAAPAQPH